MTDRMIRPDATYRHAWRKGDIVIWDNRCSYHKAAGDYPPKEDRIHWRVSLYHYRRDAHPRPTGARLSPQFPRPPRDPTPAHPRAASPPPRKNRPPRETG